MAIRPPWRRKTTEEMATPRPSDEAFKAAVGAVARGVLADEKVAKGFLNGNAAKMPGTSWSNQGGTSSALIARVTQNLASSFGRAPDELEEALAENGLSWGPPFPPGRPLDPFWGYRRPPRTWDYSVGENTQLTPRWNRISFSTLKSIIESYYAAQICVRHLINDVRSLDYQFIPPQNTMEDATEDLQAAEAFFNSPDKRQPFRAWLAEYLQDVLRYDAGALYIRRNQAGDPIALEVVSGSTIIPLIDFFGRPPVDENDEKAYPDGIWEGETVPAFAQIVEGLPWVWLAKDDLIYQPLNPLPESQYGLAPMEAVLLQANTDIRFQWHFLQYFTEGSIPAGFMEAPPDLSDPIQVAEWQEVWDAVMLGDQSKLSQVRWVPGGAKFTPVKDKDFNSDFPLYLMRCTAAAFGVTPNDLGFTEDVNRSTGEVQVDVQFRIGTLPIVRHVEDVINLFITEHLGLQARIAFDTGQGTSHRLESAQADDIYIKNGTLSPDEVRIRLGKRISRERPTPRFVDNTRGGPIPLLSLESLSGKIDATTYGPDQDQQMLDHPFIPMPGTLPVHGSREATDAANASANMQRNMLIENQDERSPQQSRSSLGVSSTPALPMDYADNDNVVKSAFAIIDVLLDRLAEKEGGMIGGANNTGGPGVNGPTAGITSDTGVQGIELVGMDKKKKKSKAKKSDDQAVEDAYKVIRQWKENSLNRVKKGLPPRRFNDISDFIAEPIWKRLQSATNRDEVIRAFQGDVLSQVDYSGRIIPPANLNLQHGDEVRVEVVHKGKKDQINQYLGRRAAGIAVQARDTGRVVMVQRVPNKHDKDDVNARWEWPGGKLDGGGDGREDESVWAGALREWHEETGAVMPPEAEICGGWTTDDGLYEGFVVRVPNESMIAFDPQPEEAAGAGWWGVDDLDDDDIRQKVHDQLGTVQPMLDEGTPDE